MMAGTEEFAALLTIMALGPIAFGIYCLFRARHQKVSAGSAKHG